MRALLTVYLTTIAGCAESASSCRFASRRAPDASGTLHVRSDQRATGPRGLFILYSDAVVRAENAGAGKTRTVLLGAPDYTIGGAMVAL